MLSIHLCLSLPSGLFPPGFPTNNLYTFLFSPIRATTILIMLGEEYTLWSSSLCSFLHPPVTPSLFGSNILLSILFSNTLSFSSHSPFLRKMCTPLLVRCHCPPIWPALPPNLTYIWIVPSKMSLGCSSCTKCLRSMCQISCPYSFA
jgi:hypothetical protein